MSTLKIPDFRRIDAAAVKVDGVLRGRQTVPVPDDGVILLQASTLRPEPVSWLWFQWLALGKFHVLAGPPGQGKTTIALACMATVSAGGNWPDGTPCTGGNVVIWSGEDDPKDTLLPRLMAMGADVSRVYFIEGTRIAGKAEPFDPARDLAQLMSKAEQVGNVRLLIVDPVVSAVAGDSHKNGETRRALQPLVELASTLQAAVLGISHFSKGTAGRDPVERVTGSLAFGALARVVLCAVKVKGADVDENKRILARAKSNIGPDDGGFEYSIVQTKLDGYPDIDASVIQWGKQLEGSARELLAEAEIDDEGVDGPSDVAEWLRDLLSSGPIASKEVKRHADEAGFAWRSVQRSMKRAGVQSRRGGFGKPAEWFLIASCATVAPVTPHTEFGANGATGGATDDAGLI